MNTERNAVPTRFLQITDVAETLNVSARQVYALINSGELPAIKVGKSWRIEAAELESYIDRAYADTRTRVESGTLTESD
ncbi:helix-turn-helix domain-containing protein [Calidifontibacter terrae]